MIAPLSVATLSCTLHQRYSTTGTLYLRQRSPPLVVSSGRVQSRGAHREQDTARAQRRTCGSESGMTLLVGGFGLSGNREAY